MPTKKNRQTTQTSCRINPAPTPGGPDTFEDARNLSGETELNLTRPNPSRPSFPFVGEGVTRRRHDKTKGD